MTVAILRERVSRYRVTWEGPVGEQRVDFGTREEAEARHVALHNAGQASQLSRVVIREVVEPLEWLPGVNRDGDPRRANIPAIVSGGAILIDGVAIMPGEVMTIRPRA